MTNHLITDYLTGNQPTTDRRAVRHIVAYPLAGKRLATDCPGSNRVATGVPTADHPSAS